MRPGRAGSDVLGFTRTIRLVYPARHKLYWIQDNLSANWTADIRAFAAANEIELAPTPTYASYLNRIESHFRVIHEFVVNNTAYRDWTTARCGVGDYITHRAAPTATDGSPRSNANTGSPHDVISGQTFWWDPSVASADRCPDVRKRA